MSTDNPLLNAALRLAESGTPIFPCVPKGKKPLGHLVPRGYLDASADPEQIKMWWSVEPEANIGVSPGALGCCVVDTDPDKETGAQIGEQNWERLQMEAGEFAPPTFTIQSPRGGFHRWFQGDLPSTVCKLAEHIDTRGTNGYVLYPPSVTPDGQYKVVCDARVAPLPDWCRVSAGREHTARAAAPGDFDTAGDMVLGSRAILDFVRAQGGSVKGSGGDAHALKCADFVLDRSRLSPEPLAELLLEHFNPYCSPAAWTYERLLTVARNATKYRQNDIGCDIATPTAEFASNPHIQAAIAEQKARPAKASRFSLLTEDEQDAIPDPEWLLPGYLPAAQTAIIYGPSQSYKSFLAIDMMLCLASGREFLGTRPVKTGPTIYATGEGRPGIKQRRKAWKKARHVDSEVPFLLTHLPRPFFDGEVEDFKAEIRKMPEKPLAIVLDTAAKAMLGLDENSAKDIGFFSAFCDSLVEEFGCAVLVVAHTGKDGEKGPRGSSAFTANFDTLIEFQGGDVESRSRKETRMRVIKHKDGEVPEGQIVLQGEIVAGCNSMVFRQITESEMREKDNSLVSNSKVHAALDYLKATSLASARPTTVLASVLTETHPTELPEQYDLRKKKTEGLLRLRSRDMLQSYCMGHGRDIKWFLPQLE